MRNLEFIRRIVVTTLHKRSTEIRKLEALSFVVHRPKLDDVESNFVLFRIRINRERPSVIGTTATASGVQGYAKVLLVRVLVVVKIGRDAGKGDVVDIVTGVVLSCFGAGYNLTA